MCQSRPGTILNPSFCWYAAMVFVLLTSPVTSCVQAATPLRQSFEMHVPEAPVPVTVQGRVRLMYELHLVNFAPEPLVLQQVTVRDGKAEIIKDINGTDLAKRLYLPGTGKSGPDAIIPGTHAVVYLEFTLSRDTLPKALTHELVFHAEGEESARPVAVRGARVAVEKNSPIVLSPPLGGGPWAAVYGPSWERGHRRVIYAVNGRAHIPGRFAIDWVKLDSKGRSAKGDADRIRNWYGYGADVLAVADGVVTIARDDMEESATISGRRKNPLEDASGNFIALDIGHGRYVFYEHLKPGSLRVKPGDRVSRGQVVASVGFTGDSMGPHLHFHVADAGTPLDAEGLPFMLDGFTLLGSYEDFDTFGKETWNPVDKKITQERINEMPLENAVVTFGVE